MTWIMATLLALAAFCMAALVLRAPRNGWEAIGAALLLGVAGYAFQARPDAPAAPKLGTKPVASDPAALVEARNRVTERGIPSTDRWIVIADALARNGQFGDAAEMLRGAVDADPGNAEAWLAMANALVSHADDRLTPAAFYAYRRASALAPEHPGPPFFLGLALARSGRFDEARGLWSRLLAQTPADAPWRAELQDKIAAVDRLMAAQQSEGTPR